MHRVLKGKEGIPRPTAGGPENGLRVSEPQRGDEPGPNAHSKLFQSPEERLSPETRSGVDVGPRESGRI